MADEPVSPPPAPVRERAIVFEDNMDRWRREAAESDARRAAAKAELRREEGDHARALFAVARIAALEQRIAELEASVAQSDETMRELARGAETFARAVDDGLLRMETKLTELSGKLVELRAAGDLHHAGVVDLPSPLIRRVN